jgi:integration host factor subunit beta
MTKAELVDEVAAQTGLTKRQSAEVLELMLQCIVEALQAGDRVELRGFGSLRSRVRGSRRGRNPKTAETVEVPAKRVPYFKTGKALHERLNPKLIQATRLTRV